MPIRDLPQDHEIWRAMKEVALSICAFRLEKKYKEADEERDLFLSIFGKYGLEIRMDKKHVFVGDKLGPLAWTQDK